MREIRQQMKKRNVDYEPNDTSAFIKNIMNSTGQYALSSNDGWGPVIPLK